MAQPTSLTNAQGQKLDVVVGSDGTVRLKLAVGTKGAAGLANDAAWQGVATHIDGAEFVASDGLVALGGVDRTGTDTVRPVIVDASGQVLVDIAQRRLRIAQTPTISSGSAYSAKDAVGGLLTFAAAARTGILSGVIEAVAVADKGAQLKALDLVLFSASVATPSDNNPFDPTDAEIATCIGIVKIVAGDYSDFNDNSIAAVRPNLSYVLAGTSMYGVLVARDTPTYTSTSDLTVTLTVRTD